MELNFPQKKTNYLPRISCSDRYRKEVDDKRKELNISYTNMIRLAFERTWKIKSE